MDKSASFGARLRAALGSGLISDEQIASLVAILREQRERVEKQCIRSYFLFIGFACVFSLLATGVIPAFDVMGVAVPSRGATALVLPLLAAYFAYRSAASATLGHMFDSALHAYWRLKFEPLVREGVTDLLTYPTPYATEAIFAETSGPHLKKVSILSGMTIAGAILLAPLAWFLVATVWIWIQPAHVFLRVLTIVAIWLLVARTIILGGQNLAMLYREVKDTASAASPEVFAKLERMEADVHEKIRQAVETRSK